MEQSEIIQKASMVLGFLVAIERRFEFIVHSPNSVEDRAKSMFGDEVLQFVSTALDKAKREMYEADARGEIYAESMFIPVVNTSLAGDRVHLKAQVGVPLTFRELALSDVLRLMSGENALGAKDL